MITDAERKIVAVNQAYTTITGFEPEEVLGKELRLHRSGRHDEAFYHGLWASLERSGQWQGEIWNRRKNGELYPAWENISVVKDGQARWRAGFVFRPGVGSGGSGEMAGERSRETMGPTLDHVFRYGVKTEMPARQRFSSRRARCRR